MNIFIFLGLIFLLVRIVKSESTSVNLISSYFKEKGLKHAVLFHCWPQNDLFQNIRKIMETDHLRLQHYDITAGDNKSVQLQCLLKVNYYKLGLFFDLDCEKHSPEIQKILSNNVYFNDSYYWLMHTYKQDLPIGFLQQLPLSINADITVATCNDICKIYDAYNPSYRHGGEIIVTFMGLWTNNAKFNVSQQIYKYRRRGNLNGLKLNCSIVVNHPPTKVDLDTYLTKPIDKHFDTMQRFNYAVIRQLRDYYNFTINLKFARTWGYLVNGSFNGILGDMVKGVVDISANPFYFKSERLDVMEYTVETWVARMAIILRHPKRNVMQNNFLKPLSDNVWWATLIVAIINWFLLFTSIMINRNCLHQNDDYKISSAQFSEISLITTAALCQQGATDVPGIISFRIIFLTLTVWAMLLYQFYSASIVGSLIAEPPRFITTVYDLANSQLAFGSHDIGYMYDLFATSTDPALRYLYDKKMAVNKKRKKLPYYSAEEGLQKVRKGGFALHIDTATAYKIIMETFTDEEICDLVEIQLVSAKPCTTAVSKHSPFKKMVMYGLRQQVEHGTTERLKNVWLYSRPKCPESHSSKPTAITFSEFFPSTVIMFIGLILAIIIIIIENILYAYKDRFKFLN